MECIFHIDADLKSSFLAWKLKMKPSMLAALLKRRADGSDEAFIVLDVRDDDCLGGHIPGRYCNSVFL